MATSNNEKINKLKNFKTEKEFREFLIDFLKKCGFRDVIHSHRFGSPEQGKDIIARYPHALEGDDWYAFVVKLGRIGGGTNEVETIKNQIKQSFEYPYSGINGDRIKVNKVKIVTNENFTTGAQSQISDSPELRMYNNHGYWWNEPLIELIDKHYSDFWLPGDAFVKEYSKSFVRKLKDEIEIRELAIRKIDDKKVQKLLDIFIEPKLTSSQIEIDKSTKEKAVKTKSIQINSITSIDENLLLSGDQGSGKTKILNSIACNIASVEKITLGKKLPIKLRAPHIRDIGYEFAKAIENEIELHSDQFWDEDVASGYRKILFIDDLDLLNHEEKQEFMAGLKQYCEIASSTYVLTYRKNHLEFDKDIKSIQVHNFNIKQIEAFVSKFFDGTERGEKFIQILKESGILAKLPTTPLTLTLISLLFDENNFEIPATLTDIYNDFVSVLLGKLEVRNRTEYLLFNLKIRLFSSLALKMLDEKRFEMPFSELVEVINNFLDERGYQIQTESEIIEIIERSGLIYKDDNNIVGFKQQAFIEFLASHEIYHHKRESHYRKLIGCFNEVSWQNTAIFYAGHSKELDKMIDDVIEGAPNDNVHDWFINTSGMGYLAQALYQTRDSERQKLIFQSLSNLTRTFSQLKLETENKDSTFYEMPLPLIASILVYWFNENHKSITLKSTLISSFDSVFQKENVFDNNFKLLMLASTLMHSYIGDESKFTELMERKEFMQNPILPLVADMSLELATFNSKSISDDKKNKLKKIIGKRREYIKAVLKEPAYRFDDDFALIPSNDLEIGKG